MNNKFFEELNKYHIHFTVNHKLLIEKFARHLSVKPAGTSLDTVMPDEIRSVCVNKNLSSVQKGKKIFVLLRSMCYPVLTAYEKEVNHIIDKIKKKEGACIIVPENLEGRNITILLKSDSDDSLELEKEFNKLNAEYKNDFSKLFKMVNCNCKSSLAKHVKIRRLKPV
jgi:hypothetical protein